MANRRCVTGDIYFSDEFLELSCVARVLYIGLMLDADDEGVVENYKKTMRILSCRKQALTELVESGYIMKLNGVYVVKDWHRHNIIPPSKKSPSMYADLLKCLIVNRKKQYEVLDGYDEIIENSEE